MGGRFYVLLAHSLASYCIRERLILVHLKNGIDSLLVARFPARSLCPKSGSCTPIPHVGATSSTVSALVAKSSDLERDFGVVRNDSATLSSRNLLVR